MSQTNLGIRGVVPENVLDLKIPLFIGPDAFVIGVPLKADLTLKFCLSLLLFKMDSRL